MSTIDDARLAVAQLGASRKRTGLNAACRALDLLVTVVVLIALLPLILLIALLIKVDSPGPVFFRQQRLGRSRRPFQVAKFRTMQHGADHDVHRDYMLTLIASGTPAPKLAGDARVTRFGGFLRRTSLDELPQLWNVIRGDMSLVGPRPLPLDEQGAAEAWQQRRLDVTPGLTCIWQIKGRSRVTFAEWVRMDVAYMRRRTILHDLSILIRTIPAVLLRKGAK